MAPNSLGFEVVRSAVFYGQRTETMSPQTITVFQEEYAHDMVALVSYLDDNTPSRYGQGVPVSITWGLLNKRVETFQGYVHHTEPIVVGEGDRAHRNVVKIVCVGATYPMKEKRQRIWTGRTIPSVLGDVFDSYKLSSHISQSAKTWDALVQAGETDWMFACGLAQRLGWTLVPNNTDVMVRARSSDLKQARNTTISFRAPQGMREQAGGLNSILTFQAVDGETTPDGGQKAQRLAYGLDPWQGTPFVASQASVAPQLGWSSPDPIFKEYSTDTARTYAEAAARLAGDAEGARFYIQADAEVVGDASVRPGKLVCLLGLGSKNNGLWYVQRAEHEVSGGTYSLHLSLGRDARWDTGFRPNLQKRRVIQPRATAFGDTVAETPPTVLVGGAWRAAYGAQVAV